MSTIANFRQSVEDRVGTLKKLAAFHLWNAVTQRSPVDTGRFRAAWNIAEGRADLSVPPEVAKGTTLPPPQPPEIGAIRPGVPIVVSNNLPYALPLEKGSSTQAPQGVAAIAVREVLGAFDGLVGQVKAQAEQGGL